MYICLDILSSSRKPSGRFCYGFRRRHHPTFVYGFRRWFFYGFRRRRKRFFMVSVVGFVIVSPSSQETCFMVSIAGLLVDSVAAGGSTILEGIERFLVCLVFLGLGSVAVCFMVSVVAGKRFCMVSVVGFCLLLPSWQGTLFYGFRRWFLFMVSVCYRTAAVSPMEAVKKEIRTFP